MHSVFHIVLDFSCISWAAGGGEWGGWTLYQLIIIISSPSLQHPALLMKRESFGFSVSMIRSYSAACLWCFGRTANLNSEIILRPQSPALINSNSLWRSGLNLHNPLDQYLAFVTGAHTRMRTKTNRHTRCLKTAYSVIQSWRQAIKRCSHRFVTTVWLSISEEMVIAG